MIDLILKMIGLATVLAVALVAIRIFWEDHIKPLKCEHHFKIQGRLWTTDATILFLKCEKCDKQKKIDLFGDYEIIPREEKNES